MAEIFEEERVIAYVDGFNLYFGLKEKGWKRYYWLNIALLCQNLLIANRKLICTKYFTTNVGTPPDKVRRQSTYLEALGTLPNFHIIRGKHLSNVVICKTCGHKHLVSKEKMTDVNIAVEMISDAYKNNYDIALLISADSDLVPVLKFIREIAPRKRIIAGFPPARHSYDLQKTAHAVFYIHESRLAKSVLPDIVVRADGFKIIKPSEWI